MQNREAWGAEANDAAVCVNGSFDVDWPDALNKAWEAGRGIFKSTDVIRLLSTSKVLSRTF